MIKCMAIDDEPWALALIADYIKKTPFLELVYTTGNAVEGLQQVLDGNVALVFLDIQMPELSGMQFMKIVNNRCRVILTTAYSEYALEGYEHNVVDYLLKPVSYERFCTAALKARDMLEPKVPELVVPVATGIQEQSNFIFLKTDSKIVKLLLGEIQLIEGLKDYIAIHTPSGKVIALESLRVMEEGLPRQRFIRVHKSYIVALDKIDSIERNRIFIGNEIVPVGDTYREAFFAAIAERKFG